MTVLYITVKTLIPDYITIYTLLRFGLQSMYNRMKHNNFHPLPFSRFWSCARGAEGHALAVCPLGDPSPLSPSSGILPVLPLPQCGIFPQPRSPSPCAGPRRPAGLHPTPPGDRQLQGKTHQVRASPHLSPVNTFYWGSKNRGARKSSFWKQISFNSTTR